MPTDLSAHRKNPALCWGLVDGIENNTSHFMVKAKHSKK